MLASIELTCFLKKKVFSKNLGENRVIFNFYFCWYKNNDIICSIDPPTPASQTAFGPCREDLEKVKRLI